MIYTCGSRFSSPPLGCSGTILPSFVNPKFGFLTPFWHYVNYNCEEAELLDFDSLAIPFFIVKYSCPEIS
jgi:hypothetical protein